MYEHYKCHECSIGQCYSSFGSETYTYCQKKPIWNKIKSQNKE